MNLRNLSILTGILAIIAVAILVYENATKPELVTSLPSGETTLLTDERMAPTATIIVKGSDKKETRIVTDKKGRWMVENHHNLPVDFAKLSRLLGGIRDANLLRFVTRNPDKASQLQIDQSSVTLLDDKGELIRKIRFGKTGKNQGTFVALDDHPEVYLSSFNGFVDGDPSAWANKQLVDAQPADVRKVTIRWMASGETSKSLTAEREKAEDTFAVSDAPEGATLKPEKLDSVLQSILSARYSSVEPASDPMPGALRIRSKSHYLSSTTGATHSPLGANPKRLRPWNRIPRKRRSLRSQPGCTSYQPMERIRSTRGCRILPFSMEHGCSITFQRVRMNFWIFPNPR